MPDHSSPLTRGETPVPNTPLAITLTRAECEALIEGTNHGGHAREHVHALLTAREKVWRALAHLPAGATPDDGPEVPPGVGFDGEDG